MSSVLGKPKPDKSAVWTELNMILKIMIVAQPFILGWAVWTTSTIFRLEPHNPRYTSKDAQRDQNKLLLDIERKLDAAITAFDRRIDALPPEAYKQKMIALDHGQRELEKGQAVIRESIIRMEGKIESIAKTLKRD